MDNLYKKGEVFNDTPLGDNEKLSPTLLNFILFHVLEKIDYRLVKEIKEKWGHLLDSNKSLHEMKDTILKGVPDILLKLEQDAELSALNYSNNKPAYRNQGKGNGSYQFRKGTRVPGKSFCRLCQTAGEPRHMFTSHNMSSCRRWTRRDVEDLR